MTMVIITDNSLMLDSGHPLGLLNAFEKTQSCKAWNPFWDIESYGPRAKMLPALHANSLRSNAQTKVNRKKLQQILVSLWHSGSISLYSPMPSVGKKQRVFYYFFPSNQSSSPNSQSINTSIMNLTANEMKNIFSFYNQAVWSSG